MDVSSPQLKPAIWCGALLLILALAATLRLHGIGNPIMDHPGWRQGDTAAIARNFAQLRFNIMYPQTMYDGPPPNYVELELQIVPFLAAVLYKIVGVHEIIGRLISLAFSLGTALLLALFGRRLFASRAAGLAAAFLYAVFPGSVYYGRTFMPDSAMVFFLTAALFAALCTLRNDAPPSWKSIAGTTLLLTLAYLAKPVALLALVPLIAMLGERAIARRRLELWAAATLILLPVLIVAAYDRRIASYAEWHWASGITRLHVLPALRDAFTSLPAFLAKCTQFRMMLGMLRATMLGSIAFALTVIGFILLPWSKPLSRSLLWSWLIAGLLYVFVVVTVERVDYYMYPLLPLAALVIGGAFALISRAVLETPGAPAARYALAGALTLPLLAVLLQSRAPVEAYYHFNDDAYLGAKALDAALPRDAVVVIGHYGPDVQYYVDRFGWEEDPLLWTPFDEESAIAKGSRYFISIEDARLRHNVELCAWMSRFPLAPSAAPWPVYATSPNRFQPGAARFWRDFRTAERAGAARAFLDSRGLCATATE